MNQLQMMLQQTATASIFISADRPTQREILIPPTDQLAQPETLSISEIQMKLEQEPVVSNASTNTRVVLFGPHDRFNFGDLLFEKVVSHLLLHRAGFSPEQLIVAGLVDIDMSAFGGHPNIKGIKSVTKMSQNQVRNGGDPFNIVFLGGQALGCNFTQAVRMLATEKNRQQAKRNRVGTEIKWNCGYLVPKVLLMPTNFTPPKAPVAVVNSAGKQNNGPCMRAVYDADYVAFRDLKPNTTLPGMESAETRPDCAVMTNVLFRDLITEQTHGGELQQILNATKQHGYFAVQMKSKAVAQPQEIAAMLDQVWQSTKMTTLFFRAGTVPGHDSLKDYQAIAKLMRSPSLIYTEENLWGVVAVIREARAVLSTSLHVRIMAFVHNRPRITLCTSSKHSSFVELWDRTFPCLGAKDFTQVIPVVRRSLATPKPASVATQRAIDRATTLYLEGFDKWSKLLY